MNLDKKTKVFIIAFAIWMGYCAYQVSQSGRYQYVSGLDTLDTHTGKFQTLTKDGYKKL
jgi:hypothetical protein